MTKRCRRGGDKGKSIYLRLDDFTIEVCIVKQLLISRWVYDCMSNSNRKPSNRNRSNLMFIVVSLSPPYGDGARERPTL